MTKDRFEALERHCQRLKKAKIMKMVLFLFIVTFFTFTLFYFSHQLGKEPIRVSEQSSLKIESIGKEEIAQNSKAMINTDEKRYDTLMLSPAIKEVSTTK